ncbi:hypothetical protein O9929_22895 [Vibrio lentus]|nr:hypothetical protein [Vibrio lentus]
MVIVKTKPWLRTVGRKISRYRPNSLPEIIGTVGGNDTVLIIPKDTMNIDACEQAVCRVRFGAVLLARAVLLQLRS